MAAFAVASMARLAASVAPVKLAIRCGRAVAAVLMALADVVSVCSAAAVLPTADYLLV
jgi:hypothetical protein